jgi:tRNA A37 threonylcarbamoyltransferase TsaD
LKNILQGLGYNAKAINEGLAVVFSELQDENFTGIGVSFGGGMCNVCVAFMSMPMISFSTPKGGDYIDQSVSEVLNETSTRVRLRKEDSLDLSRPPRDEITSALHIYYEDVLQTLINRLRDELEGSRHMPTIDRPIPIVLSGGTAKPAGFQQKFESMLKASNFPLQISDIRMAGDPLAATAIGCHIAALSEAR